MERRGEMGIGTLIVFIALLLIATSVSGMLIRTAVEVQEKELTVAKKASAQVSTNLRVIEVSATDGRDGILENFSMILKLSPGSEDIKLKDALLTLTSYNGTADLAYGGKDSEISNGPGGYYTVTQRQASEIVERTAPFAAQVELLRDYDFDNKIDYLTGGLAGGDAYILLGGPGTQVQIGRCNTSDHFVTQISDSSNAYRNQGDPYTCQGGDLTMLALYRNQTRQDIGNGFFAVEFLQNGINPIAGTIQRGDVVRIYFQAPTDIGEAETVTLRFIPKLGTPTITQFRTPDGIEEERVYLYP